MTSWFKAKLGRVRLSTVALVLAFIALFWVNQNYQPDPPAATVDPAQQVVPPGFVPDPNYTWVPRTNVRPREPEYPTPPPRTTPTTTTTTTTPRRPTDHHVAGRGDDHHGPRRPGLPGPTTTVIDPDGPGRAEPADLHSGAGDGAAHTVEPSAPQPLTTAAPALVPG